TVSYLSPEQADGTPIDGRSDLFSLGIVFHEMLTMQRLFASGPQYEIIQRIRRADVPRPSTLVGGVPADVEAIVMRMLARDPEERFEGGEARAEALLPITRRPGGTPALLRRFATELAPERRAAPAPFEIGQHTQQFSPPPSAPPP